MSTTSTNVVVVGVDGSPTASLAASKAASLASAYGAELYVVCAFGSVESEVIQAGGETLEFTTAGDSQYLADSIAQELRRDHSSLKVTAIAAEGKPANVLVREAERLGADVIIVGNKRVQGLARILGSVASAVASHATCDVYIAHTHSRD